MSKLSPADSKRLTCLRWPLIVAVVFIHANNDRIGLETPQEGVARWAFWIRKGISEGLAAPAVPLFFLISGYLFCCGPALDRASYGNKLRRRVRTLLIPFLFWNLALAVVLALATRLPQTQGLLSGSQGAFLEGGPLAWGRAILGVDGAPVAYQFWFLRDLMLAVLLMPFAALLYRASRPAGGLALAVIGALWATHAWPIAIPGATSLFFFFGGALLARRGVSLFAMRAFAWPLGVCFLVFVAAETAGLTGATDSTLYAGLHQVGILLGVVSTLAFTAHWAELRGLGDRVAALSGSAFFLFAMHEPTLTVVKRLGYKVLPITSPLADLGFYFASIALVVILGLGLHAVLRRWLPRLTALVTGGR